MSLTAEPTSPAKPARLSRRAFFKRVAGWSAAPLVAGVYASQVEPFWPQYREVTIPIPHLPPSFENYRIAQLTDLHAGRTPFGYLTRVIDRVRAMRPDLVVATGDLIHHNPDVIDAASQLVAGFPVPVLVSYGNHEFGVERSSDEPFDPQLPEKFETALTRAGCTVLRNRATTISRGDDRLWFVGLDDLWYGDFNAARAFAGVPRRRPDGEAMIVLSHNPDTAETLDLYQPRLILAGHTHGGQVRVPGIGAIQLNTQNRRYDQGLFQLRNSHLYVSRGIGYVRRVRFNCRPEIPIFRLVRAA